MQKVETGQEEILSNLFLDKLEKTCGNKSENENIQYIHPLQALQNGKFALSEISSETKRNPKQKNKQKQIHTITLTLQFLSENSHQNM